MISISLLVRIITNVHGMSRLLFRRNFVVFKHQTDHWTDLLSQRPIQSIGFVMLFHLVEVAQLSLMTRIESSLVQLLENLRMKNLIAQLKRKWKQNWRFQICLSPQILAICLFASRSVNLPPTEPQRLLTIDIDDPETETDIFQYSKLWA
jgi:hypothetical protein